MKLKMSSHTEANVKVTGDNEVKIKLKTGVPVKLTTRLYESTDGTDKLLEGYVFIQRKDKDAVCLHVGFPSDGFFKFEIFANEESNEAESLPNVYNYLFEVNRNSKPAIPYAKAYTKFYTDYCQLDEPMALCSTSSGLDNMKFEMVVPGAEKVSVHCGEEWFHLTKKGSEWEGRADLGKYKGKNSKVTVNANYDKNSNSFSVLLDYTI